MHRLGFEQNDVKRLVSLMKKNEAHLYVKSVWSHLASSEDPEEDSFTELQAARFEKYCSVIEEEIGYDFIKHLANSAAVLRLPHLQYNMVRLGIVLFGLDNTKVCQHELQVVARLRTTISQLRRVAACDTVGYGRKGKVECDSLIGVIRIGYADGFDRRLSNGVGFVWCKGVSCPVIGDVCMDMAMIDFTHINNVQEGDEVEVFGENIKLQEIAQ
ncbi:unnamed protein product, partial [Didymodactylos carnosus]